MASVAPSATRANASTAAVAARNELDFNMDDYLLTSCRVTSRTGEHPRATQSLTPYPA